MVPLQVVKIFRGNNGNCTCSNNWNWNNGFQMVFITKNDKEYKKTRGVSQSSILGPLLWDLYFDSVIKTEKMRILCYADTMEEHRTEVSTALEGTERSIEEKELQILE